MPLAEFGIPYATNGCLPLVPYQQITIPVTFTGPSIPGGDSVGFAFKWRSPPTQAVVFTHAPYNEQTRQYEWPIDRTLTHSTGSREFGEIDWANVSYGDSRTLYFRLFGPGDWDSWTTVLEEYSWDFSLDPELPTISAEVELTDCNPRMARVHFHVDHQPWSWSYEVYDEWGWDLYYDSGSFPAGGCVGDAVTSEFPLPNNNYTIRITAANGNGSTTTTFPLKPFGMGASLSADTVTVQPGDPVTLHWTISGRPGKLATGTLMPGDIPVGGLIQENLRVEGDVIVYPTETTTYQLRVWHNCVNTIAKVRIGYMARKPFVIRPDHIDEDLDDFRLLVRIAGDADIGALARPDGFDLRFTTAGGQLLSYERESFEIVNGLAYGRFWVRVPKLLSLFDTTIYCLYGDPADTTDESSGPATWGTDEYRGVWHLGRDPHWLSYTRDSSGYGGHFQRFPTGSDLVDTAGIVGEAQQLSGSHFLRGYGDTEMCRISGSSPRTAEGWCRTSSTDNQPVNLIFWGLTYYGNYGFGPRIGDGAPNEFVLSFGPGVQAPLASGVNACDGQWHHFAATYDGATAKLYIDGELKNSAAVALNTSDNTLAIGNYLPGDLDECRLHYVARSAAWLKFTYWNIYSADNEGTWGAEERPGDSVAESSTSAASASDAPITSSTSLPTSGGDTSDACDFSVQAIELQAGRPAINEKQQITLPTGTIGGTYTLSFGGQTTTGIAYDAAASTVQSALEALPTIGAENVGVTGDAGGPWVVEFKGDFAAIDVPLLEGNGESLTGTFSITAEEITKGRLSNEKWRFSTTDEGPQWYLHIKLPWNPGQYTPMLHATATAAQVQAALETLDRINPGDVIVTRTDYTGYPHAVHRFEIEWTGQYAGVNMDDAASYYAEQPDFLPMYMDVTPAGGEENIPEVQDITIPIASGGTYTLAYYGQTTAAIAYNADAAAIQSALQDLSAIGEGNVTVALHATDSQHKIYRVTFAGSLAGSDQPLIIGDGADLSGGTLTVDLMQLSQTPRNERQQILLTNNPHGGTFTLRFPGAAEDTAPLARAASASAVQTALEALAEVAAGDVVVTGVAGGPWIVEYQGSYAATNMALMTGDASNLTGLGCQSSSESVPTSEPVSEVSESASESDSSDGLGSQSSSESVPTSDVAPVDSSSLSSVSWVSSSEATSTSLPLPSTSVSSEPASAGSTSEVSASQSSSESVPTSDVSPSAHSWSSSATSIGPSSRDSLSCAPWEFDPHGRQGIGVVQPQSGVDYPLVALSTDVRYPAMRLAATWPLTISR